MYCVVFLFWYVVVSVMLKGLSCSPPIVVVHMGEHSADTINARVGTFFGGLSSVWTAKRYVMVCCVSQRLVV